MWPYKNRRCPYFQSGYTFIEILITLAIMAVLFVPLMQLFSNSLYAASDSADRVTAINLARWQMEKIRNLNLTKTQLYQLGGQVYPPLGEPPLLLNEKKWRIESDFVKGTDPLELRVRVYREAGDRPLGASRDKNLGDKKPVNLAPRKPVTTLVTLVEDMLWEEIKSA